MKLTKEQQEAIIDHTVRFTYYTAKTEKYATALTDAQRLVVARLVVETELENLEQKEKKGKPLALGQNVSAFNINLFYVLNGGKKKPSFAEQDAIDPLFERAVQKMVQQHILPSRLDLPSSFFQTEEEKKNFPKGIFVSKSVAAYRSVLA